MGRMSAIGTIIALVIGAGILGIPYVVARAGFWNGFLQIFIIGCLMALLNLFVGEVVLSTKGKHQLVELAEMYLGEAWEKLMFIIFTLGHYGALLAYLIGIKTVLVAMFGTAGITISLLMFAGLALLLLLRLHMIAKVETLLTVIMVSLIGIVCLYLFPSVNFNNLTTIDSEPLGAYGVILFAFMGFTIIPEIVQDLKHKKELTKVIFESFMVITLINALFAYVFVGTYGLNVMDIATNSLTGIFLFIGGFLVLSMLITSYLAVGLIMKDMFVMDFELKPLTSWILAIIPPFLMLILANPTFIKVLGIAGSFTAGLEGIIILYLVLIVRKRGNRTPEYRVFGGSALVYVLMLALLAGIVWQATHI